MTWLRKTKFLNQFCIIPVLIHNSESMGIVLKYFAFNFGTDLSLPLLELKPSVLDPQCEDTIDDDMRDRETKRTDADADDHPREAEEAS